MIIIFIAILTVLALPVHSQQGDNGDKAIFEKGMASLSSAGAQPVNAYMVEAALFFLGKPYVGGTLEVNDEEGLVVNLRELDCTTLVENCLAMSLTKRSSDESFEAFRENLQRIRYRKGVIDGYVSRLHYSSDWIVENEAAGYIRDVTKEIGGKPLPLDVYYMSANPGSYKRLTNHPEDIPAIREVEERINGREYYYIPKGEISRFEDKIRDGDLVYFVTSVKGLDIAHVGIAYRHNGELSFIHASSTAKRVIINPDSLYRYCQNIKSNKGIVVCRLSD